MTETIIQKSIYLRAMREQVWDFLVDPKKLSSWFNRPNARLQQDQPLEMYGAQSGDTIIWGTVTAERPPEYLEYTFVVKPMGDTVSVVKWTLTQVPGGTRLSLEHSGLPQGTEAFGLLLSLDKGWEEHLTRLRADLSEIS
ncbi:SRPBCC family protein [Sedimentitalea nanhaiensis]|uniref:Uncharacterized conserved protein YndB, AHSA1/START domain n=1 Tax=Sedimentitalea nanhaiensis TaxID=999627 RepID=A0A1I6ZY28_9RHOB|nr:SRPBCC domain-containing protein [Sedimentitalea nanhaiensis]SFT67559.1 Uncharacterized conserved protein YndB, AHSA1/START domain [Sedimentitalea nanhaiensis]